jgi:hypothetical protein
MSERVSSVLSFSDSGESSSSKSMPETGLNVADVPEWILEALHWIRALQLRGTDSEGKEMAAKAEECLKDVPACLAAAAAQLAEVAL